MKTDQQSAEEKILPLSPPTAEPGGVPREKTKAEYRKSVLRRLGVLRSVAGSQDPFLPAEEG